MRFKSKLRDLFESMKLDIAQKLALAAAAFVAVALCIIAGSSAKGGGGPQGNQFGRASAGGPGFGPGNNPGVDGGANGRSIASDASSSRSDGHEASSHSGSVGDKEEVIDTNADGGSGKARSEEERATNDADTTGGMHVLTRISSETGVPMETLRLQKSTTRLGYGDLETANLLAKASGQSFDAIVAKFKAGEGWGKIARDLGLNLGKIVSAAHRSSLENKKKHLGQEQSENSGKRSLIPGPGVHEDSIIFTGITPIPSATASRGVNPAPSATMNPRP
jgi:hypothetical protein